MREWEVLIIAGSRCRQQPVSGKSYTRHGIGHIGGEVPISLICHYLKFRIRRLEPLEHKPKGAKQGQLTLEDFELDGVGRIVACPEGHLPIWTSVSETRLAVRFDTTPCQQCPEMETCPGYLTSRADDQRRWQYTHERVAQRQRRLDEQQPKFKDRYRWRAGIEATMSRLKHQMGLAHLRIRGMATVKYHVFLRALGLNVLRVAASLRS